MTIAQRKADPHHPGTIYTSVRAGESYRHIVVELPRTYTLDELRERMDWMFLTVRHGHERVGYYHLWRLFLDDNGRQLFDDHDGKRPASLRWVRRTRQHVLDYLAQIPQEGHHVRKTKAS